MDRVLEIGGYAAGYCGRLFAQAGCEVVRAEGFEASAPWVSDRALELFLHPGKRRVGTDSLDLLADLAAKADVVVADADTADALTELGFDAWQAPVKVAITPFGRSGPKRNWRATPNVLLAMGGYTNLMGDSDRAPLTLPGHFVEFQSGCLAYTAANAVRLANESKVVDVGMLEVVMALSQFTTVMWHCAGAIRSRHGSDFWSVVPSNLFRCADGWVYVNIVPTFWDGFCAFLERPELLLDPRFEGNDQRMTNRDALHEIIQSSLVALTTAEVETRAEAYRIPVGIVRSFEDVLAEPHLAERQFWQQLAEGGRDLRVPRPPWRIAGEPGLELQLAKAERGDD